MVHVCTWYVRMYVEGMNPLYRVCVPQYTVEYILYACTCMYLYVMSTPPFEHDTVVNWIIGVHAYLWPLPGVFGL